MSEVSRGDGWWQASDLKWYPPQDHPSAPPPPSDGGYADPWRAGRLVILAGAVGTVAGALIASAVDDSRRGVLDRSTSGAVALSLLLLLLAVWNVRAWGLGKLAAVAFLAAGAVLFTLFDFGDGTPLWEAHTGIDLVGRWLQVGSAAVALLGVPWSLAELLRPSPQRTEDVTLSVSWWQRWGLLLVGVVIALWIIGRLFSDNEVAQPADRPTGPVADEWSIVTHPSEDGGTYRDVHMITTLDAVDPSTIDGLSGRLVWNDTDLELCGVEIIWGDDEVIQVGGYFPTVEECESAMVDAFEEHGLPEIGCLYVTVDGVEDELCEALVLDESALGEG